MSAILSSNAKPDSKLTRLAGVARRQFRVGHNSTRASWSEQVELARLVLGCNRGRFEVASSDYN